MQEPFHLEKRAPFLPPCHSQTATSSTHAYPDFSSVYNPYDPFLANSLAQVQAGGLGGLDPRLQNLAAMAAQGLAANNPAAHGGPGGVRHNFAGMAAAAAAAQGLGGANLSLQAAVLNQSAHAAYGPGGLSAA